MERNKSIDGLRTRAEKNVEPSNIDGLKSRSTQPVFKTAKLSSHGTDGFSTRVKTKIVKPSTTTKVKKTVRATLVPTKDEDLLAAFSEDEIDENYRSEEELKAVSESFIEPSNDIYADEESDYESNALDGALNKTNLYDDDDEKLVPDVVNNNMKEKTSKKDKKSQKDTDSEEEVKGKTPKQKKPVSKARRIITTIVLILVLGVIGTVTWAVLWGNDIIAKITGGRGNIFDAIGALMSGDTYEPLKTDSNKRTNILAFGTSGWDMAGDIGGGVHDGAQLTDSIMAISINQETGDVAMLSLPRDLKASPTCTATGKINEVYWCNNMYGDKEEDGANALMKEVGNILGLEFQYFAHINWGSLVTIVDTLDGIKVTLDEDIADYGSTGAVFSAGVEYTINGEQALGLARARHGTAQGDFTRGNSQQKILMGIKNKLYEKNLSLTDILGLVSSLGDNLRTNLSVSEIKTAAHLTFEFDFNAMRQLPLMDYENGAVFMSYATINEISYVVPAAGVGNYSRIREYVRINLNNNPVVREQARILVLNGSEKVGAAADERDKLRSEEYNVTDVDNVEGDYTEPYYIFFTNKDYSGTVEALEKKYSIVAEERFPEGIDGEKYDIVIVLGGPKEEVVAE